MEHVEIDALPPVTEEMVRGLSEGQRREVLSASAELGRLAAKQHGEQVEWAHSRVQTIAAGLIPQLETMTGHRWEVTVESEPTEGEVATHVVALTEAIPPAIGQPAMVVDRRLEVMVSTMMEFRGTKDGVVIAYRTQTRALTLEIDEETGEEVPLLSQVAKDRVVAVSVD